MIIINIYPPNRINIVRAITTSAVFITIRMSLGVISDISVKIDR